MTSANFTPTGALISLVLAAAVAFLPAAGCSPGEFGIRSHSFGKNINARGEATEGPLSYTFRPFRRGGTGRDLFNFLYFEGDTLCFSVKFSEPLTNARAEAWIVNPKTGMRYRAERLEISGTTLWGFSLVGSLMEKFYAEMSGKPLPPGSFCCTKIPFELHIALRKPGRKLITAQYAGTFQLQYRRQ